MFHLRLAVEAASVDALPAVALSAGGLSELLLLLLGIAFVAHRRGQRLLSVALAGVSAVSAILLMRPVGHPTTPGELVLTPAAAALVVGLAAAMAALQRGRVARVLAIVGGAAVAGLCALSLAGYGLGVQPAREWGLVAGRISLPATLIGLAGGIALVRAARSRLVRPLPLLTASLAMLGVVALLGARVAALHHGTEEQMRSAVALLAESSRLKQAVVELRFVASSRAPTPAVTKTVGDLQGVIADSLARMRGLVAERDELDLIAALARTLDRPMEADSDAVGGEPERLPETMIAALIETVERRLEARMLAASEAAHRVYRLALFAATFALLILGVAAVYAQRQSHAAMEASRLKSEFLANTSHEIRTSLNGVVGMLQMLDGPRLASEEREQVHVALSSADTLMRLLNDILDIAKIESGKLELESIPVSLRHLLEEVQGLLRARAAEKAIAFTVDADPNVPAVVAGDPVRLKQVLLNLCANAIKFTDAGKVRVALTCGEIKANKAALSFTVEDTGRGIPVPAQRRLFRVFEQGDASTARKFGGSGLGLIISQRLVQQMGGEIRIESEVGRGSRFWFEIELPLAVQSSSPVVHAPSELCRASKILVAEDDRVNRLVISSLLKKIGFACVEVPDGAAVVEFGLREDWDIILMDVQMPILDGLEATRRLRSAGKTMPIIALTANVMPQDRVACDRAGMDGFLAKPVREAELAQCLHRWLPKKDVYTTTLATGAPAAVQTPCSQRDSWCPSPGDVRASLPRQR